MEIIGDNFKRLLFSRLREFSTSHLSKTGLQLLTLNEAWLLVNSVRQITILYQKLQVHH